MAICRQAAPTPYCETRSLATAFCCGEPIVCSPQDAYRCFMACNMDVLVLERFVLHKEEQPNARPIDVKEYLASFELD